MRHRGVLAVVAAVVPLCGCGAGSGTDRGASRPAQFGYQTSVQTTLIEEGKRVYGQYCVGCHGIEGDGAGDAAKYLRPRPRNFQRASFKFSSTRSGRLPTDDDLRRTIRNGLKGSAMPTFSLLTTRQIDAVVDYIKTFSPKWAQRGPSSPIPTVDNPYKSSPDKGEAIRRGEALYHGFAGCWNCHPAYVPEPRINEFLVAFGNVAREGFRAGLDGAVAKPNTDGELVYPPDFRRDFVRAGSRVEDLYRSIGAGISGTAMPTWIDSIDVPGDEPGDPPLTGASDIWAMAYYVQSLIIERPARLTEHSVVVRDRPFKIGPLEPIPADQAEPASEEFLGEDEEYFDEFEDEGG